MVKALDSAWVVNDRNSSWIKLKPDYVHATEIDALIIGIYKPTHGRSELLSFARVVFTCRLYLLAGDWWYVMDLMCVWCSLRILPCAFVLPPLPLSPSLPICLCLCVLLRALAHVCASVRVYVRVYMCARAHVFSVRAFVCMSVCVRAHEQSTLDGWRMK